jgi:hypothetical protein
MHNTFLPKVSTRFKNRPREISVPVSLSAKVGISIEAFRHSGLNLVKKKAPQLKKMNLRLGLIGGREDSLFIFRKLSTVRKPERRLGVQTTRVITCCASRLPASLAHLASERPLIQLCKSTVILCKPLLERLNFQSHRNQIVLTDASGSHAPKARLLIEISNVVFDSVQALFDLCYPTFQPKYFLLCRLIIVSQGRRRNPKDCRQHEAYEKHQQQSPLHQTSPVVHGSPPRN